MKKIEAENRIIETLYSNLHLDSEREDFSKTYPIQLQTLDEEDDTHEFAEKLEMILNRAFPEYIRHIQVDSCDSVEDILRNNFKFDEN